MPKPALTRHWLWQSLLIYLWIANGGFLIEARQNRRALDLELASAETKNVLQIKNKPSELSPEHTELGAIHPAQPATLENEPHANDARHTPPIHEDAANVTPQTEPLPSRKINPVSRTNRITSENDSGGKVGLQTLIHNAEGLSQTIHDGSALTQGFSGGAEARKTVEAFGVSVKALVQKFESLLRFAPTERSIVGGLTSEAKKADYATQQTIAVRHKNHEVFQAAAAAGSGRTSHGFATATRIVPPLKQGITNTHLVLKFLEDFMPSLSAAMLQQSKTLVKENSLLAQHRKSMLSSATALKARPPSAELLLRRLRLHQHPDLPSVHGTSGSRAPIVEAKPNPAAELPSLQSHVGQVGIDHLLLRPQNPVLPDSNAPAMGFLGNKAGQEHSRKVLDTVLPNTLMSEAAHHLVPNERPLVPYNQPIPDVQASSSALSDVRSTSTYKPAHLPAEFTQTLEKHAMIMFSVLEKGKTRPLYSVALTQTRDSAGTHFTLLVIVDANLQKRFSEAHKAHFMMPVMGKDEHQSAANVIALTPDRSPVVSGSKPEVTIDPMFRQRLDEALHAFSKSAKGFSSHAVSSDINSHLKSNRVALIEDHPLSKPGTPQIPNTSPAHNNLLSLVGPVSDSSKRLNSNIHQDLTKTATLASHQPVIHNLKTSSDARPNPKVVNPDEFLVPRFKTLAQDKATAVAAQGHLPTLPENQNNRGKSHLHGHSLVELLGKAATDNHPAKLKPSAAETSSSLKTHWQPPIGDPAIQVPVASKEQHSSPHAGIEATAQSPVTTVPTRSGTETHANAAATEDKVRANHLNNGPNLALLNLDQVEIEKSRHQSQGQSTALNMFHKAITEKRPREGELRPIEEKHSTKEGPHPINENPSASEIQEILEVHQPPSKDDPVAHLPEPAEHGRLATGPLAQTETQARVPVRRKSRGGSADFQVLVPYYHPGTLASIVSPKETQAISGKAGKNLKRLDRFLADWWPRVKSMISAPLERLQRLLSTAFLLRTSRPPI